MKKLLGILLLAFITTVGFSGALAAAPLGSESNAQVINSGNSLNVNTNVNRVDVRNRGLFRDDFRRFDRDDRFRDDFRRFDRDNLFRDDFRRFDDGRRILIIHRDGKTIIIVLNNRRHHRHHHGFIL
ncbi:MAG TPA: hypothetical protein VK426_03705 [Methanobacterium sp.]|nr:hypothetical protein [Methanobacterium sp.]